MPYNALETRMCAVPRCTLVAGQIDLHTGGEGGGDGALWMINILVGIIG